MLLFAANPLVHFYAGDPYDILLATALMTAFVYYGWLALNTGSFRRLWIASACLAVAFTLRSQFLSIALLWPGLVVGHALWARRSLNFGLRAIVPTLVPAVATLAIMTLAQGWATGHYRALPWQGPFMLAVTNDPDLFTGYSYRQQFNVSSLGDARFPVEEEARLLFTIETGEAFTVDAANNYFRQRFRERILDDPIAWMALPMRRSYAFVNDHEAYDNKTWSLQKSLHPWLRWNPIGWGMLLVVATGGALSLARGRPPLALLCALAFLGYAAVLILVLPNSRYRLPLYPIVAVSAAFAPQILSGSWPQKQRVYPLALAALAALLTFSRFGGVAAEDTRLADYILMAHAELQAGEDPSALRWTDAAATLAPGRPDVRELQLVALFNLTVYDSVPLRSTTKAVYQVLSTYQRPELQFLLGWAALRNGDLETALRHWAMGLNSPDSSDEVRGNCLAGLLYFAPQNPQFRIQAAKVSHTSWLLQRVLASATPAEDSVLRQIFGHQFDGRE